MQLSGYSSWMRGSCRNCPRQMSNFFSYWRSGALTDSTSTIFCTFYKSEDWWSAFAASPTPNPSIVERFAHNNHLGGNRRCKHAAVPVACLTAWAELQSDFAKRRSAQALNALQRMGWSTGIINGKGDPTIKLLCSGVRTHQTAACREAARLKVLPPYGFFTCVLWLILFLTSHSQSIDNIFW